MQQSEAVKLVEQHLNKDFNPSETGELIVSDQFTIERSYGWIFYYNTRRFAETKERRFRVIGNGPVIFLKSDQSIHHLDSGTPPEQAIAKFENKYNLNR